MSKQDVLNRVFSTVDKSLRPASIAQIGGFRPSEAPITSWFGGHFVGDVNAKWPTTDGQPMLPLLQVRVDELPFIPPSLDGMALFNVFVGPRKLPIHLPASNGNGWWIQTYATLDALMPLDGAPDSKIRPFPVRWSIADNEGPQWEDAPLDNDTTGEFCELDDCFELFSQKYKRHYGTKVGGWPTYTQSSPGMTESYIFQISSEQKPNWMWGDNGNGYFYLHRGEWLLHWDCY